MKRQEDKVDLSLLAKEQDFLTAGLKSMHISVDDKDRDNLLRFYGYFRFKNKTMNLTGLTQYKDILSALFLDSLALIPYLDGLKIDNILDVGTGPGFPGLPLKIARPKLKITLLDSAKKKLGFCQLAALSLNLKNIGILEGRAEVLAKDPRYYESFDLVCSKAVANFTELAKLCLPFVRHQGRFIAYKSQSVMNEITVAESLLQSLNSKVVEIKKVCLPEAIQPHYLVIVEKVGKSDNKL